MSSVVPTEIAGIGSTAQKLRVSPGFDPLKSGVGPEEYFVFSRIDGKQTLREVLLATGLPLDRSIAIIVRLRSIGALLLPNETAPPPPPKAPLPPRTLTPSVPPVARTQTPSAAARKPTGSPAPLVPPPPAAPVRRDLDVTLPNATQDEIAALSEHSELSDAERRRVLALARLIHAEPHDLLGVPRGADAKVLKRAYFMLSKEIHPDVYYGKRLGTFNDRLSRVFEAVSRAYARLTTTEAPRTQQQHANAEHAQTPTEYAAELFERACTLEVSGEHLEAMKLFAAAVRIDAQPRYLRRAASCAIAAGQPRSAMEYAKKAQGLAPDDPSAARLLAAAFRAAGKLADAEEVLVMAMALKSENDVLTSELRNDLADVRRQLSQ